MADEALDIADVTVRFGGLTALDGVTLRARAGAITGIIGPNGAGKTTLLNAVCGLVRPRHGQISFGGTQLAGIRPDKLAGLGVARTLQAGGLCAGLTVLENVMIGATPHARAGFWSALGGLPRSDRDERRLRDRALAALDRVGAADLSDSMPGALAHGPRKRVALARALAAEPRLLLLDEPASGLSGSELGWLGDLLTGLAADACVLVIEHRMDLMMSVCDMIFVLDFGKLIASGPPSAVQADPLVTEAYLGASGPAFPPVQPAAAAASPAATPSSPGQPGEHGRPGDGSGR